MAGRQWYAETAFCLYSREFSDFLISGFKSTYKEFVAASGFTEYIEECAVKARVNKRYLLVYNRIAFKDNRIYYNLNNSENEVVRIDDSEIVVLTQSELSLDDPVFVSSKNMGVQVKHQDSDAAALPDIVNKYFNLASENDIVLLICTIVAWFWPNQIRPILLFCGPAGSGKAWHQN